MIVNNWLKIFFSVFTTVMMMGLGCPFWVAHGQSLSINSSNKIIKLMIYKADSVCDNFIPEMINLPSKNSLSVVIGKIIQSRNSSDFFINGYRVNINQQKIATIDLRLHPDSPRQISSLSTCEKMALFGSLRQTLINNSVWGIKEVIFTEQGAEIYL
jgi:hypothetical protein